jgi:threonine aldolase
MAIHLDVDGAYADTSFAPRLSAALGRVAAPDSYGEGPLVRECEAALAKLLGKERAVLFPTGTLANMVALDRLCGPRARRVLVHPDSHVMNDTGDSLAAVMGLTAVAAAPAGAGFPGQAVRDAAANARTGKVAQSLGAICIETPVRRRRNEAFPADLLADTIATARQLGIGLHLDGARLPIAAAASGRSMAAFSADYDTVYLSLWKMFGLPFGAVLAGPVGLLDGVEHDRRRHGGALPQLWPIAAVVLAEIDRLEPDWRRSLEWRDAFLLALAAVGGPAVVAAGDTPTNCFWLRPKSGVVAFKGRCKAADIVLGEIDGDLVLARANPTLLGESPEGVARRLAELDQGGRTPE